MCDGTEVKEQDVFIVTYTGTKRCRETTKGVEVLVHLKYGSITWGTLKDIKNSYPVHMAEYMVQNHIVGGPIFA